MKKLIIQILTLFVFITEGYTQQNKSMTMDKEAKTVIENMAKHYAENANKIATMSDAQKLEAGRKGYEGIIPMAGEAEKVFTIENRKVVSKKGHQIPIRVYRPNDKKKLPMLLYIHGGGFTAGNLETHDRPLRVLANRSGFLVIGIDYRLAPEHPYPAGLNDCYEVLQWLSDNAEIINGNAEQIYIGGDSAGGNLAAVTTLMARDKNGPSIKGQLLIYPNTDLTLDSTSWQELGDKGYILTKKAMSANVAMYTSDDQSINHEYVSPLKSDNLSKIPETLIITAGFDPLHSEGEAYVQKLKSAKVKVTHWHYDGQVHGFFQMGAAITEGDQLITRICQFLKDTN